jgi:hypothetical protein
VSWGLESNGKFSVSSLYHKINQGPSLPHESLLWSAKLPLKIKIFLWQMAKGRLPSNAQTNRRHGASDGNCALCGQFETVDHIFFSCHLAFCLERNQGSFGGSVEPSIFLGFLPDLKLPFLEF